jgi:hypothetical protein
MYVFAIMHYTPVLIFFVILLYLHCVKYFLLVYTVSLSLSLSLSLSRLVSVLMIGFRCPPL